MLEQGSIVNVRTRTLGDELTANAALNATTLTVGDAVDFNERGGTLSLNGVTYTYTAVDDETGVITLASGLTAAAVAGDAVTLRGSETTAYVLFDGEDDAISAHVPMYLRDRVALADGIRAPGHGETVTVDRDGDWWILADVLDADPDVDGTYIARDTVTDLVNLPPDDDEPVSFTTDPTSTTTRVEIDPDRGFRFIQADGSVTVQMATDTGTAALQAEDITTDHLTAGGAAFRGATELAKGGVTTLSTGTTSPESPPAVTVDWATTNLPTLGDSFYRKQAAFGGGLWYVPRSHMINNGTYVDKVNTSGVLQSTFSLGNVDTVYGCTVLGSNFYLLTYNFGTNTLRIRAYSTSNGAWVDAAVISQPSGVSFQTGNSGGPTLGNDGTNLLVAQTSGKQPYVQAYTTALVATGSVWVGGIGDGAMQDEGGKDVYLAGVAYGSFDFSDGTVRYAFGTQRMATGDKIRFYTAVGNGHRVNDEAPAAVSGPSGMEWDGTAFWTHSPTQLFKHTGITWTTDPAKWWARITWFRSGAGYETMMGTAKGFTMKRRARLKVASPTTIPQGATLAADDPDSVRIYLGRIAGATPAGRSIMWKQADLAVGAISATYTTTPTFTGTNPPAASTFPSASPHQFTSAAGGLVVKGDGTGIWPSQQRVFGRWTKSVAQTVSNATYEQVPFGVNHSDVFTMSDASGLVFTIPQTGIYRIAVQVAYVASSVGRRSIGVTLNTATTPTAGTDFFMGGNVAAATPGSTTVTADATLKLTAGNTLRIWTQQNSGAGLAFETVAFGGCYFEILKEGVV